MHFSFSVSKLYLNKKKTVGPTSPKPLYPVNGRQTITRRLDESHNATATKTKKHHHDESHGKTTNKRHRPKLIYFQATPKQLLVISLMIIASFRKGRVTDARVLRQNTHVTPRTFDSFYHNRILQITPAYVSSRLSLPRISYLWKRPIR